MSGSFYKSKYSDLGSQDEDNHFICDEMQTIGVADGVSGWGMRGVDAGIYARQLINNSLLATLTKTHPIDPMKVLDEAFAKMKAVGCSRACIISLHKDKMLHAVKMGDSGFMVIGQGAAIYRSLVIKVVVQAGDVIVAGTDGLFDNLSESQISETAVTGIERGLHPEDVAWQVAQ
ncbi:probable protein phosphatase 2C 80 [Hibiscus syriacus]|nr:probable protein phosphatase 2C 80 [Hibiscus syriacus]